MNALLRLVLAGTLLCSAETALAQTGAPEPLAPAPPPAQSALRTLVEKPGRVIITRLRPLEPIRLERGGSLRVNAVGAFEPGLEEERTLGLRLDLEGPGLTGEDGHHFLDVHEIELLLQGIFLLEQVVAEARDGFENEADYETIEGFTVGVAVRGGQVGFWVQGGRSVPLRLGLGRADVTTLRQRLELARSHLFTD